MANIDLSIIIVNYNTRALLDQLLTSITNAEKGNYRTEIILVDNASSDGSLEMVRKKYHFVKSIPCRDNLGFAAANNKGIRNSKGGLLLLLNSDTKIFPKTLKVMLDFMKENSDFQAATCRVELPDGKLDPACHRGFPSPWASFTYFSKLERLFPRSKFFAQYHQGWKNLAEIHEVDVISGAFFLLKREVIDKVGLLDEGFFMYGEDIDWCMRIKQAKFRIVFVPSTKIIHVKGMSGRRKQESNLSELELTKNQINRHFCTTMKLFYKKHYAQKYPKVLMWLIFRIIDWQVRRLSSN